MGILGKVFGFITKPVEILLETRKIKKAADAQMVEEYAKAKARVMIAEAEAEAALHEARAKKELILAEHAAEWEIVQAEASKTSWKDEYLTILLTIPLGAMFSTIIVAAFPNSEETLQRMYVAMDMAWVQMNNVPDNYWWLVFACVSAVFGLRITDKFKPKGS